MEIPKVAEELIANHKKKPLAYDIFSMANSFNEANQVVEKQGLIAPAIINLAFSIELLLKSFILSERLEIYYSKDLGKQARSVYGGHKFYELFCKIGMKNQNIILKALGRKIKKKLDNASFKALLIENNCEDPFVVWRYIFEGEEISTIKYDFLIAFCHTLGELLAKELDENKYNSDVSQIELNNEKTS